MESFWKYPQSLLVIVLLEVEERQELLSFNMKICVPICDFYGFKANKTE